MTQRRDSHMSFDPQQDLAARIDHTILRPDATRADVMQLCEEAVQYRFTVVFVPPCYAAQAIKALAGRPVRVGIPVGFPHGMQTTAAKVGEAVEAVGLGVTVLDMVMNVSLLKSGDQALVRDDIAAVVHATPGAEHKVILETGYLTREEKLLACRLVIDAGADYVKTSTGFGPGGATVEDVQLLAQAAAGRAKVKASGGIRTLAATQALLTAGADRIGTSAGVAIMKEWRTALASSRP
ncbi:MAG: deoxyribose-phosphate aldolase [Nitrospirae bacterium]|nr:MAG: deoxyribose-phosphate aldolase [Nitrospirota bacterium]